MPIVFGDDLYGGGNYGDAGAVFGGDFIADLDTHLELFTRISTLALFNRTTANQLHDRTTALTPDGDED